MEVLRDRLAAHITAGLAAWPAGEAATFADQLRRFITDGPFG